MRALYAMAAGCATAGAGLCYAFSKQGTDEEIMVEKQGATNAVLEDRLKRVTDDLETLQRQVDSLRADRFRIEGGKWVLWWIGGALLAVVTLYCSIRVLLK